MNLRNLAIAAILAVGALLITFGVGELRGQVEGTGLFSAEMAWLSAATGAVLVLAALIWVAVLFIAVGPDGTDEPPSTAVPPDPRQAEQQLSTGDSVRPA